MAASSLGFDVARLARIRTWMADLVRDKALPCASILITRKDRVVFEHQEGVPEDAIYRIFSMTKPIASVALMMLVEEGKVRLSDPVHLYIPSFHRAKMHVFAGPSPSSAEDASSPSSAYLKDPVHHSITIEQLLSHTSGLSHGIDTPGLFCAVDAIYAKNNVTPTPGNSKANTLAEYVDLLASMPLVAQPGTLWHYSASPDVLGRIVEVVSGTDLRTFLRERILGPLAMKDTDFVFDSARISRLPSIFMPHGSGAGLHDITHHHVDRYLLGSPKKKIWSGASGLAGTARDYARFCSMLINGGELDGQRLLSPRTVAFMTANQLPNGRDIRDMSVAQISEVPPPGVGFGLGMSVVTDPVKAKTLATKGVYAWGGAANTIFWIDPVEGLSVVFMTQLMYADPQKLPLRAILETLVYSALVQPSARL